MIRAAVLLCTLAACAADDPFEYQVGFIPGTAQITIDGVVNSPPIELEFPSYADARTRVLSVTVTHDQVSSTLEISPGECRLLIEQHTLGIMQLERVTYLVASTFPALSIDSLTCVGTENGIVINHN